jgi:hypothetical protein
MPHTEIAGNAIVQVGFGVKATDQLRYKNPELARRGKARLSGVLRMGGTH